MRAHTLEGGEEEQDQADAERGGPYLLWCEGLRILVAEGPHGKRRGRLNAHQREHVGQHHNPGPQSADGRFLAEARGELDHAGDGEVGVVVAASVTAGRAPFTDVGFGELGKALVEGVPSAGRVQGDDAGDDDAEPQQDTLHGIHVGDRSETSGAHVDQHHQRQDPHPDFLGQQSVGQHVEQEARGSQLHAEVRDREQQSHHDHQNADCVTLEIVGQHFARRHVAEALAQHPLPLEEHDPGKGDGDGVEGRIGILEPVTIDEARVSHERPT